MTLHSFDVVLMPYPYAGRLQEKVRPAVVVSRETMAEAAGLLWFAMVTSSSLAPVKGDVAIDDLDASGLHVPCRVRTIKVAALAEARVVRHLGRLAAPDASRVLDGLRGWLPDAP